ncbi:hypothetical protein FRX31_019823, partial [Thalictrum thalictroides]
MANTRSQSIHPRDASPHAVHEVQSNVVIDVVLPTRNVVVGMVIPTSKNGLVNHVGDASDASRPLRQLRKLKNQNNSLRRKLKRPRAGQPDDAISSTPSHPKAHSSIWNRLSGPGINFLPFTIPETSENNLDSGYQKDDDLTERNHEGHTKLPVHGRTRLNQPGVFILQMLLQRFNNGHHTHPNVHTGQTRHLVSNASDAIIKAKVLEAHAAAMRHNSAMRNTAYAASHALAASNESGATVDTQSVDVVDISNSFQGSG